MWHVRCGAWPYSRGEPIGLNIALLAASFSCKALTLLRKSRKDCTEFSRVGGKGSRTTERADRKKLIADTPKEGGAKRCGGVSAGVPDLVERVNSDDSE